MRKDYDGAERMFRKAIELNPQHTHARWNLSLILENQKNDVPSAIKLIEECVRLGGVSGFDGEQRLTRLRAKLAAAKSPAAWYSEGLALKKEKKWPEAVAAFQNCVALDANHSKAWFWLGQSYYLQNGSKNCEASYEPYTRCIALDPKNALAHGNLGSVLQYVRKDYDGAERHYRKAIELDPKAYACWNLSLILEKQKNDIPGAVKQMEEYVRLGGIPGWNDGKERLATLRAKLETSTQ